MQSTQEISRIMSKTAISLDKLSIANFQKKGTMTAQLRQVVSVVSSYPSARVSNDKQDNLFGTAEFGFTNQEFTSQETRIAFLNVPLGTTEEIMKEKLAGATSACIYKALSNRPILTEDQAYAIGNIDGVSMDTFADSQIVRYPDGHVQAGQIILDNNGKPQYRAVFFWSTPKEDEDYRTNASDDFYVSPAIAGELAGKDATVVAEQGL